MTVIPLQILTDIGITTIVLPFLLIFSILYAILMKTKILGERADINAVIAFTIALLSAILGVGSLINMVLPNLMLFLIIGIITLMIFLGIGLTTGDIQKWLKHPVAWLMILLLVIALAMAGMQDYLTLQASIPQELVNQTGNVTGRTVILNGSMYELIGGRYWKEGASGMNYLLGSPEFIGTIAFLVVLAVASYALTHPGLESKP